MYNSMPHRVPQKTISVIDQTAGRLSAVGISVSKKSFEPLTADNIRNEWTNYAARPFRRDRVITGGYISQQLSHVFDQRGKR